jgi:hypothetical protein
MPLVRRAQPPLGIGLHLSPNIFPPRGVSMAEPRQVQLDPTPDVQVLGDALVLRGHALLEMYRAATEGIQVSRQRNCIEPSRSLQKAIAGAKAASSVGRRQRSADMGDIADVRARPTLAALRTGERIGVEEVARMCGVGHRQARRLAPSLGGTKTRKGWIFDRGLVQAYIDSEGRSA